MGAAPLEWVRNLGNEAPGRSPSALLGKLMIFLNPPPGRCDGDQPGQWDRSGCPAPVERQFAGIAVPPGQQHAVPAAVPFGSILAGHLQAAVLAAAPAAPAEDFSSAVSSTISTASP